MHGLTIKSVYNTFLYAVHILNFLRLLIFYSYIGACILSLLSKTCFNLLPLCQIGSLYSTQWICDFLCTDFFVWSVIPDIFLVFSLLQFCHLLYVGSCPAALSESLDFWLFLTLHHTLGLIFLLGSCGLFQTLILWGRGGTILMQRSSEDLLCNTLLGLLFFLGLWIWCQLMYVGTGFLF